MRLTDRQTAVLAALERTEPCTLPDLKDQLPAMTPSALLRVVYSLRDKGFVGVIVEPKIIYLGAVSFFVVPGR